MVLRKQVYWAESALQGVAGTEWFVIAELEDQISIALMRAGHRRGQHGQDSLRVTVGIQRPIDSRRGGADVKVDRKSIATS